MAAELLVAFRDKDKGVKGEAGALLVAEFLQLVSATLRKG